MQWSRWEVSSSVHTHNHFDNASSTKSLALPLVKEERLKARILHNWRSGPGQGCKHSNSQISLFSRQSPFSSLSSLSLFHSIFAKISSPASSHKIKYSFYDMIKKKYTFLIPSSLKNMHFQGMRSAPILTIVLEAQIWRISFWIWKRSNSSSIPLCVPEVF